MEEKFDDFVKYVTDKLEKLEAKVEDRDRDHLRAEILSDCQPIRENSTVLSETAQAASSPAHVSGAIGDFQDTQGDFQCLRDALSRIKLPADFKLNESRQGIRRIDQQLFSALVKCARYNETLVKLLTTLQPGSTLELETLDQLFVIAHAQCRYLQDEYAALVVNSQFDNSTSKLFRVLQRNTSGLNPASLETLRSAATIAAASRPSTRGGYSGRGRGRYNSNRGGHSGDVFNHFASRSFPRRQWKGDNSNSNHERDDE